MTTFFHYFVYRLQRFSPALPPGSDFKLLRLTPVFLFGATFSIFFFGFEHLESGVYVVSFCV